MNVTVIIESGISVNVTEPCIQNIDVSLVGIQGPPGIPGSGGSGISTGNYYPLNANPSGYITTGQTGNFGASGNFYPLNGNPSGYITTGQTGVFGISVNTGQLTGAFYPLNNNPYNYITSTQTGNFVTSNQTGIFITTGQTGAFGNPINTGSLTGQFYPLYLNPLGYLTGFNSGLYTLNSNTGIFITTGQTGSFSNSTNTGILTGIFYPYYSNPSGYITTGQTGAFGSGGSVNTGQLINIFYPLSGNPSGYINNNNDLVYTTGVQFIVNDKYFTNNIVITGGAGENAYFSQKSNTEFVWGLNVNSLNSDQMDVPSDSAFKFGMMTTNYNQGGYNGLHLQAQNSGIGTWSDAPTIWTVDVNGNMFANGYIIAENFQTNLFVDTPQVIYNDSTSVNLASNLLINHTGLETLDWNNRVLLTDSGVSVVDWKNATLNDNNAQSSVEWNNRILYYTDGQTTILNWQGLYLNDAGGISSIDWGSRILKDDFQNYSVQYGDRFLRNSVQDYVLDWNNRILSGNWDLGSGTGIFITTGMTGSFVTTVNTGNLINQFYPLNYNPSGYLTPRSYFAGTVNIPSGTNQQFINFSSNFTGINYSIGFSFDGTSGTTTVGSTTNKTISGFTIILGSSINYNVNLDYTAYLYN